MDRSAGMPVKVVNWAFATGGAHVECTRKLKGIKLIA